MTDREAFIRRICEEPDEDTHRLVFADWLQENGEDEQAEFIRVQVVLAVFERWCVDPSSGIATPRGTNIDALRRRERELLMKAYAWTPKHRDGLVWWLHKEDAQPLSRFMEFQRGFVHAITCTHDEFLRHAEAVFSAHPVERVTISDREPIEHYINGKWTWLFPSLGWHQNQFTARATLSEELRPHLSLKFRDNATAAILDLSAACVSLGRKRAGLPTLPQHSTGRATLGKSDGSG